MIEAQAISYNYTPLIYDEKKIGFGKNKDEK